MMMTYKISDAHVIYYSAAKCLAVVMVIQRSSSFQIIHAKGRVKFMMQIYKLRLKWILVQNESLESLPDLGWKNG
jgi:hypothetical protein